MTSLLDTVDQVFVNAFHALLGAIASLGLPEWVIALVRMFAPVGCVLAIFAAFAAFLTWLERKTLARIQNRLGPNRVGPFGLFQPIADGLKAITKEIIIPKAADKLLHALAPVLVMVPSIAVYALLPFGKNMTAANIGVGVLMFFALSSISTLALFVAGWGSRNKYSLIGAMRAIAQMISYELPIIMAAVPAVMIAGSMNTSNIVAAQGPQGDGVLGTVAHWFVWQPWGMVGFLAFFVAGMAELNRSPFDIAEGESEIIAGFHTEYTGMKFALFFFAEYLAAIAFCGLTVTLFLGGFHGPPILPSWVWFFGKVFVLILLMMWIRGTLPRLRGDQLMGFSWKFLLPLSLVNIFATGVWHFAKGPGGHRSVGAWLVAAAILGPTYYALARINTGRVAERRNYRYAKL